MVYDDRVDIHQYLSLQMVYLISLLQYESSDPARIKVDLYEMLDAKAAKGCTNEDTQRLLHLMKA